MNGNDYLTLPEVAELLGVTHASAAEYHKRATKRRKDGDVKPADMPPPDHRFGTTPAWRRRTIEAWLPRRGTHPKRKH